MGTNSTFFFQPGVPSRVNPLIPNLNQELTEKIAKYHADYLDKIGSLYYSKENYDDFYFGKGSTYPDVNGGMEYYLSKVALEATYKIVKMVSYVSFAIRNQLTTTRSTLKAASSLKNELCIYERLYVNNFNESTKLKYKELVLEIT